ncbi:Transmembrane protein 185-like [Nymphon striatum]|nr:Transmembrane protein 185-like [Nymphon striatum]
MNLKNLFQDLNPSKFLVYTSLLIFTLLFALRLDGDIKWSYWAVFLPLWIWKMIVFFGAIIGSYVWWKHPEYRIEGDGYVQYKSMLISFALHLLLALFELLVCDKLQTDRHLWILVFIPMIFLAIVSIAVVIWAVKHDRSFEINKKIITECRKAKDNWLNQQCQEIENLEQHFKAKEMHKRVKQLTGKSKTAKGSGCIKNKDGDILFEQEEIAARWVEYITELYEDEREPMPQFEITKGENILKDEVEKAIRSMKNGKATGPDHISAETLKALDENNIDILTNLCRVIYNNGQIPPEMKQSIFITLPKKHKTQNCSEHRTISLMSHVTKLLLKIILQRITNKINQELELFCSVNILQYIFLALKLDNFTSWKWVIMFVPTWIVMCVALVGIMYAIIFAILLLRTPEVNQEQKQASVYSACAYSLIVIPLLIFLILFTDKLDGRLSASYLTTCIPLFISFLTLITLSFGSKGGNQWWFGIRKDFCHFILAICPLLREYGNISYSLHDNEEDTSSVDIESSIDLESPNNKSELNEPKAMFPSSTIESPD